MRKYFKRTFRIDTATFCESEVSQADANLCDPPPDTNPPVQVASANTAQTCRLQCANGSFQSYTTGAGSFVALSQAQADAQAYNFACQAAAILCAGGTVTAVTNTPQSCTMTCPGGPSRTYTAAAGLFTGMTQAEANALAYNFACVVASLSCTPPPGGGGTSGDGTGGITGGTGGGQGDSGTGSGTGGGPGTGSGTNPNPTPVWFGNAAQVASGPCPNGGTYTFPVPGGLFLRPTQAEANAVALSYGQNKVSGSPYCLGSLGSTCCLRQNYSSTIQITPDATASWSLDGGSLPPGLSLGSGTVSGNPILAGTYYFSIRATLPDGSYSQRSYSLTVTELVLGNIQLIFCVGSPYSATISLTPSEPATWTSVGGALPGGLTLDSATGVISGTPTGSGTFSVTIRATLENGCSGEKTYLMHAVEISAAFPTAEEGDAYSESVTVIGYSDPVIYSISAGALPPGLTIDASTGIVSGVPTEASANVEADHPFTFTVQVAGSDFSCTKEFNLIVHSAFNGIVWTQQSFVALGTSPGTGSAVANGWGASSAVEGQPSPPGSGIVTGGTTKLEGYLNYNNTGAARNANLRVTAFVQNPVQGSNTHFGCINNATVIANETGPVTNTYNFPFTLVPGLNAMTFEWSGQVFYQDTAFVPPVGEVTYSVRFDQI